MFVFVAVVFSCMSLTKAQGTGHDNHNVAFSVGLSSTQYVNNNDTLIYDKIFLNEQNSYDKTTGHFVCMTPGIYIFHFHAYNSNHDSVMWLELLHNGKPIVSLSGLNSHSVGGNTVILRLQAADRVHIQSKEKQQFSLFGLADQVYTTFSGYIISADGGGHATGAGSSLIG